jgi:hypothetical protein
MQCARAARASLFDMNIPQARINLVFRLYRKQAGISQP